MNFRNPNYKNKFEKRESRKKAIIDYVKNEIKKGNKPNYHDICKKFNISLCEYTSIGDLYRKLGLPKNYGRLKKVSVQLLLL